MTLREEMKGMRWYHKLLAVWSMVICFAHHALASTSDSLSLKMMEQTWQEFRAIHPFGMQTVALKHYGDTCVFVISEPPGWVKETDLRLLFEKYRGVLTTKSQPYGIDGMLTDAVGCAKLDRARFAQLKKNLFTLLYGTDYKAFFTDLDHPAEHVYFSDVPLDYSFSDDDFHDQKFPIKGFNGSVRDVSIKGLARLPMANTNDIFYSKRRGMVAWVIGEKTDYHNDRSFQINARRFALDTDLICGMFRGKDRIVILAREREVPVSVLPPLRSETIISLAAANQEPSLVFDSSGTTVIDDTLFVAPIVMNEALNDTELGNLMYLTDMMLKSWSDNGRVTDHALHYPQPGTYPFPLGVSDVMGDSVQMLWDTSTIVPKYMLPFLGIVPHTGSLSPVYRTDCDSLTMEKAAVDDTAYDYFTRLNCPELVRAKMYMCLSVFFHGHGLIQNVDDEHSWVQTPSYTLSNARWPFGGYICPGPKSPIKGLTNINSKTSWVKTPTTIGRTGLQNIAQAYKFWSGEKTRTTFGRTGVVNVSKKNTGRRNSRGGNVGKKNSNSQYRTPSKQTLRHDNFNPRSVTSNVEDIVKSLSVKPVHPTDKSGRGLTDAHVKPSADAKMLSADEVSDKVRASAMNRAMMMEMRAQIQKYGIPLKAIIIEKNGTAHIIFIYHNQLYDYAA